MSPEIIHQIIDYLKKASKELDWASRYGDGLTEDKDPLGWHLLSCEIRGFLKGIGKW